MCWPCRWVVGPRQAGAAGPSRQEWTLSMLAEHEISIFALQETRGKTVRRHHDSRYHLIRSAATPHGHFGMMIGLSKIHPHGWRDDVPVLFGDQNYLVLVAQPRLLILQVRSQALKCVIVASHAPHSGASLAEIDLFWQEATAKILSNIAYIEKRPSHLIRG